MSALDVVLNTKLAASGQRAEDGVPDMTVISDIDVEGVNTNLLVRFKRGEIYTMTGTILVAVNPYEYYNLYEEKTMKKYQGKKFGDLPPHVFATAEAAYQRIQYSDDNQSCVISGESGAGKTETTKFILQYLCTITSTTSNWVEQQILECNVILEAFGNAATVRNDNSSRFGKFMQVCFNKDIEIKGMIVQEYLLEQSRITFQSEGERNYHVFYQIAKGGDKKELLLDSVDSYNYINQSGIYDLPKVDDKKMLDELRMALTVLNVEEPLQDGMFAVVSAILHIGNLEFEDAGESVSLTARDLKICAKVAKLMKIDTAGVEKVATTRMIVVRGESTDIPLKLVEAKENKHAMAKALYSRTFTWLIDAINSTTTPGEGDNKFIGVLDIFGFENFGVNSFEQLCINFTNEKLHKFFNHYVFQLEQAEYIREEINFAHIEFTDNTICLELLEKPPMCVLKLLDEECKIPKGSDTFYLEKQHAGLGAHPNYIKGKDQRRHGIEFGILHFAGAVTYTVDGFLMKNKDVDQALLFDMMRDSTDPFVKDVTRFQDMLALERKMIMGKKAMKAEMDAGGGMSRRKSVTMTNKSKPTVGDTFRRQLQQLVDILDTTTPWYVRCIKPNSTKTAKGYEDQLVIDQLNYSGMLDIVRIRREGFPVHVPFDVFVTKYRAMAQVMKKKLDDDPKKAACQILQYIKAPTTEWQAGKTKIFLRNSVFEPLEDKIRALLYDKVVLIQKMWRGYFERKKFIKTKLSILKIQAAIIGAPKRLDFILKRRNATLIQAWWRGNMAREFVKALRIKQAKEIEKRRKAAEEQRKKDAAAMGDAAMEDSFLTAQKELYAISKFTEAKAGEYQATLKRRSKKGNDLDSMFTMLADDEGPNAAELAGLEGELEAVFKKPMETMRVKKTDGTRTIRRKKRTNKQMDEHEAARMAMEDEEGNFNPSEFPMIKFAEDYFNPWPKTTGTMGRSSRRIKQKAEEDPLPKEDMLVYSKDIKLPTSMIHMHSPANVTLACTMYKDINRYLRKELKPEVEIQCFQSVVAYCLEQVELRDEIYCQIIRQITNNPSPDEQIRGWHMLAICCASFPPGKILYPYLRAFIKTYATDNLVGKFAQAAERFVKKVKFNGARRMAPGEVEINAIGQQQHIITRFYFMDGKAKAIGIQPAWTIADVIKAISDKVGLINVAGWALYESTPQTEHFIRNHEYIGDILAEWEVDRRSSVKLKPYQTITRGGATQALGLGDAKFVFRKRLFLDPKKIPTDPCEYGLLYAQAVHSCVRADEFPVSESTALKLAGLQAQIVWGDAKPYEPGAETRYEDIDAFLPWRVRTTPPRPGMPRRTNVDWMKEIFNAHTQYGNGKTDVQAKVLYLTAVKQYPLYGGTFFDVKYLGFWSYPERLLLSIDVGGFKFVHMITKEVFAEYPFSALQNVAVNAYEETIIFNMNSSAGVSGDNFMFLCPRKDDVANLIASYSPQHRNWKQVGVALQGMKRATDEEKNTLAYEVSRCRSSLARSGLLQPPPAKSKGILATTLRRMSSAKKSAKDDPEATEAEKLFTNEYWSYSKNKITQPLMDFTSPMLHDIAVKTFASLLMFAGLLQPSEDGFAELTGADPEHITLIQEVIARCLEKEETCDELYMQMIKQTTSHPKPDDKSNLQNWRFLLLCVGVVVPRKALLIKYLEAHLRYYGLQADTEEGQYARHISAALKRTIENKNRKYPPSTNEIKCVINRQPIYARFYFMDGEFRALMFDPAATTAEVVSMVKERIGLAQDVAGFSLFEVFGSLERNMLPWEKVGDAIFKWEKYGKSTRSPKELHLTFKKRLFLGPYDVPKGQTEFDLTLYQAIDDVRTDKYPITQEESMMLIALHAQMELGNWDPEINYEGIIDAYLPKYMHTSVDVGEVARQHKLLQGKDARVCKQLYLKFIMSWPLYGATVFEVVQSYTTTLPKSLWLAVTESGINIMRRRTKVPLISYAYKDIVNYSPSLRNLMIVTESLTRGTKFVFNTSQASQIAHLIKDYTHIIIQRSSGGAPTKGPNTAPPQTPFSNPALAQPPAKKQERPSSMEFDGFGEEDVMMEGSGVKSGGDGFKRRGSGGYGF
jgi:myosin-7